MNTFKAKINSYLSKNCIFIFAIVTFLIMLHRVPFWDETHAFSIARLKLDEILYITRIEGHTALWYLIIKPFSSLNLYPWSMWILNWSFCLGAIWVLWKKAPFSSIIKTFITFSTPFLYYFAPVARCYSVGILFLFLICAYYKKRFQKPYLFSFLIVAAAHTSVMAAVGAFYIGLIYLFDLFLKLKKKTFAIKKYYGVIVIFLTSALLLILQFVGMRKPEMENKIDVWSNLSRVVLLPQGVTIFPFIFHLVCSIAFYYYAFVFYRKNKRGFFFVSATYLTLTFIFLMVYQGSHWNYYFYFIYFIMLFWIFGKKILKNNFSKILFVGILFLSLFPKAVLETGKMDLIYASRSDKIAKQILENKQFKNSKLYTLEWWSDLAPGALIYLERRGVFVYDLHNRKRTSFESIKNIFYMKNELIDFDEFYLNMDKNSYLLSMGSLFKQKFINLGVYKKDKDYIFKTQNKTYYLKMVYESNDTNLTVYKIYEK